MADEKAGQGAQAGVHVVDGDEQRAVLAAKLVEVHAPRALVGGHGAGEAQRQQARRDDADDTCVHALGPDRRLGPPAQLHGVAAGIFALQLVEQTLGMPGAGFIEHADDLGHGPVLLGHRLKDVGDVAGQIVRGGKRPERVALVVFARAECGGDSDDVLLGGMPVLTSDVVERVVPQRAVHAHKVELVHLVTLFAQVRGHFAIQDALGVEHDVGALGLQQVRLQVVARLTAVRAAKHEHVVVQAASPRVGVGRAVGREQHAALVGAAFCGACGVGRGVGGESGGVVLEHGCLSLQLVDHAVGQTGFDGGFGFEVGVLRG